jgi:hypothetical protein
LRELRGFDRSSIPSVVGPAASRKHHSLPWSATKQSSLPAGFPKSRVYAKLSLDLFLERYQTFNGHFACYRMNGPE